MHLSDRFSLHAGRLRLVRLGRAHIHDVLVVDKDADVIGISVLSGVHLPLARQIREAQRAAGVDDIPLVVGGTIPAQDVPALTGLGVRAVYGVGTPIDDVVAGVMALNHGDLNHGDLDGGTE